MKSKSPFCKTPAFYCGIVLTVIEGLLSGCTYLSIYLILRHLLNGTVTAQVIQQIAGMLAVIFVLRLAIYSTGYVKVQIGGAAVSMRLRLFLGDKFKRIPLARFTQGQVGQYVNTMTSDVANYEKILTHDSGNIAKNVTLSAVLVGFTCVVYLPAGLILLAAVLLLIPDLWLSFRIVKKYGTARNAICAEAVSSIVEYVSGIQTFRAYGVGGTRNKATTQVMKDFSDVSYQYEAKGIPVGFGFNILVYLTVPLIMALAARPWAAGALRSADYLMVSMMPILLTKLLTTISIDLFSWKNLMISKANIQKVADEPEESGSADPLVVPAHDITFRNVRFSYVKGEPVLQGVSFHAEDQKLTAIVGDSGSGKSTILNLISKYYEADRGSIAIGGRDICDVAAERVLEQISMVDQDVFLFNDTVRENIRHARPSATDEEVEAACRAANCDGFIRKMEQGYETEIGENGSLLSGGERQRLSIARAILKNSPILLLDEATANLDIENELAVKQAILRLLEQKKTVVMIAHTLSIVKNADQILVVSGGKIAESGTHTELLQQRGKYAAMWAAEQCLTA
ncbi:MAG: ABC transporter ATP-binding protein [Eubacteriales bacterium]|nr:ABC transporter ATP-binding protein [Eubacteriales bacterium]